MMMGVMAITLTEVVYLQLPH